MIGWRSSSRADSGARRVEGRAGQEHPPGRRQAADRLDDRGREGLALYRPADPVVRRPRDHRRCRQHRLRGAVRASGRACDRRGRQPCRWSATRCRRCRSDTITSCCCSPPRRCGPRTTSIGAIELCISRDAPACISVCEPDKSPVLDVRGSAPTQVIKPLFPAERIAHRRQDLPRSMRSTARSMSAPSRQLAAGETFLVPGDGRLRHAEGALVRHRHASLICKIVDFLLHSRTAA